MAVEARELGGGDTYIPTDSELYGPIMTSLSGLLASGGDYDFDPATTVKNSLKGMVGSGMQLEAFQQVLLVEHCDDILAGGAWGELSEVTQQVLEESHQ